MIQFTCPVCDRNLKARDELAGKSVKCPGGHAVQVPCPVEDKDEPIPVVALAESEQELSDMPHGQTRVNASKRKPLIYLLVGVALVLILSSVGLFAFFFFDLAPASEPTLTRPISIGGGDLLLMRSTVVDFKKRYVHVVGMQGIEFTDKHPVEGLESKRVLGLYDGSENELQQAEADKVDHMVRGTVAATSEYKLDLKGKNGLNYAVYLTGDGRIVAFKEIGTDRYLSPIFDYEHRKIYLTHVRGVGSGPNGDRFIGDIGLSRDCPVIGMDTKNVIGHTSWLGLSTRNIRNNPAPAEHAPLPVVSSKISPRVMQLRGDDNAMYVLFINRTGTISLVAPTTWVRENVWK